MMNCCTNYPSRMRTIIHLTSHSMRVLRGLFFCMFDCFENFVCYLRHEGNPPVRRSLAEIQFFCPALFQFIRIFFYIAKQIYY
jgi:hypothetical protein